MSIYATVAQKAEWAAEYAEACKHGDPAIEETDFLLLMQAEHAARVCAKTAKELVGSSSKPLYMQPADVAARTVELAILALAEEA